MAWGYGAMKRSQTKRPPTEAASNIASRLHATASARLSIAAAVTLALLAQSILVQAGGPQPPADSPANRPLEGFAIAAEIPLALLAEPVLVFASQTQLFTLSTASGAPAVI